MKLRINTKDHTIAEDELGNPVLKHLDIHPNDFVEIVDAYNSQDFESDAVLGLQSQLDSAEREIENLEEEVRDLNTEISSLESTIASLEDALVEAKEERP
jgi:septal ring factor EnvC (AmiA/AmiB activator)